MLNSSRCKKVKRYMKYTTARFYTFFNMKISRTEKDYKTDFE